MKKLLLSLAIPILAIASVSAQENETLKNAETILSQSRQRIEAVNKRYLFPLNKDADITGQKPTGLKKRLIAASGNLDSIRYYYGTYRGSDFPTVLDNIYTYFAPLYTPYSGGKNVPYDSAAKWHRNYAPPDTMLHKRRTYTNSYNTASQVIGIHNPSNMIGEMGNAPISMGEQFLNITNNAAGLPTQFDYYYDTSWTLDANYYHGNEQYVFYGKHIISYNNNNAPVTDIFKQKDIDSFHNDYKFSYYYNTAGKYDSIITAKWDTIPFSNPIAIDWIDTGRSYFTYGTNGNYLMISWVLVPDSGWYRNDMLKEEFDASHRQINMEHSIFNRPNNTYYTDSKEVKTYNSASLLPETDSTYLGYQAYLNANGSLSYFVFNSPSVWVPYRYKKYYTNTQGDVDSFFDNQNYDVLSSGFIDGWLPVTRVLLTYNSDHLVTFYNAFSNYTAPINWHDLDRTKYYYETYEDTPPNNTGIKQVGHLADVCWLYPNPGKGSIALGFAQATREPHNVVMTDASGKVVFNKIVKADEIINTSSLGAGIYSVVVLDLKGLPIQKTKVVIVP